MILNAEIAEIAEQEKGFSLSYSAVSAISAFKSP
jgi:hypothetical protein